MANPTFSQPERRNLFLPIALAVLLFAAATYLILRYTPHRTADLTITHATSWQAHTVFKSDTILVGQDKAQDDLYVLIDLRIDDRLRLPLFINDITATLTTADGKTLITGSAGQNDLTQIFLVFPALKALSSKPMLEDTEIQPGQWAEGMVLFQFPIAKDIWDHRQSATITVDLYHQAPQTITIPKS